MVKARIVKYLIIFVFNKGDSFLIDLIYFYLKSCKGCFLTMVPERQKHGQSEFQLPPNNDGERIVVSGMSGLFPKSISVQEFSDILYNKINPISTDDQRFTLNHPELVPYTANVPDVNQFDAQFFKVHFRQANIMDPMSRKILEQAYQAIYDAGLNPEELSGTNVGVFVGACFSETDKSSVYDGKAVTGFGVTGCCKSMFANRVSYWLNGKGPSAAIDSLCCSSISALEQAYLAMMQGRCDCSIVAGSYLCLHPQSAINLARVVPMSRDGKTFSFDERAQGCARSEAINVLFLQKAKNALRIYADVLHVKSEYVGMIKESTSPKFGFYRDLNNTIDFLKTFYKEAGISADAIEYFEAFGCATPEVDKVELQAIQELFCKNRDNKPLLIGSVMSNIGYGEAASGLSAITKVLLGYHNGKLAANLHCEQPRKDIEALHDGRMRILDEHQTFDRSYVAVNGLSVTGVNSHVLLHGHYKPKDLSRYKTSIPHLVTVTGRHEEAVKWLHQNLKSNPVDDEQLALLRNIHKRNIAGHVGRGYIILQADEEQKTVILREKTDYADLSRRPLWFVYSGMGSQWAGMGTQLMRIPIFVAAIERCRQALKPTGLDIVEIITSPDETIFNNILHSFVGIAAVQIGLTDILHAMGLKPDGIIGHSVGELGCAYADGCLTAEEMILSAYYRGMVSLETKFIHGSMAAVGVGYKQISQMCPPEIEVACRNGPDSSTISGPSDVMREFVAKLTADGIFAKEVPCSNIAYHSRYIADAGPGLLKYLQKAIPNPKVRSKRWLSTSVPEARWNEPIAELCSAEYLTNNLLSPVLFEETSLLVPSEAVLVEIAPHGLLQAILTRSLRSCKSIPLTKRKHPDNTLFLLEAIGKLHMEGFNFDVQALYPKVEMPVSTGTPFLSHLVKWAHNERWPLSIHCLANKRQGANCDFILALHDQEYSYVRGHTIRGDTLFPLAASLMLVWDTLSMVMGVPKRQMSVEFQNIKSYAQPVLHDGRQLKLSVTIHRGEGGFEILDGISRVATGYIKPLLRDRDYSYGGEFQSIDCADESLSEAMIEWRDNWVTFIDGMLQLNMLRQQHNAVSHPTRIQKLHIDVKEHTQTLVTLPKLDGKVLVRAEVLEKSDLTRCGGVVLQAIKYQHLPPVNDTKMTLKTLTFVPHFKSKLDVHYAGITSNDIKHANGSLFSAQNVKTYGMDFSGITERGQPVMGVVRSGAASNQVRAQPELLWPVPAHWSLEDAATVPLAYLQAFYCLGIKVQLLRGRTVLVHGGAGALGQAIISIALAHDCEVFTTVSDIHKKQFLLKLFPQLKADHIGKSRDIAFIDTLRQTVGEKKCDIIISSAKGSVKDITLKCSAFGGIFLDTSQIQNREDYDFGMSNLWESRTYSRVDFSSMLEPENVDNISVINKMISEGIARGYVRPLSRITYATGEVARAFRFLAENSHRGRVLLRMKDNTIQAQYRLKCSPDHCYLILCNSTSFGVQLADRLVAKGVKLLYVHVQKQSSYLQYKIRSWQELGVKVGISSERLNSQKAVASLLTNATRLGPLEGVYVTTDDNNNDIYSSLISDLDVETKNISCDLKHFVVVYFRDNSIEKDVCLNRIYNQLPATVVTLPELKSESYNSYPKWRSAMDALESALQHTRGVILAHLERGPKPSLLKQIESLTGLSIPENTPKTTTLEQLGIGNNKLQSLCAFLRVQYNLGLDEEQVSSLTIEQLLQEERKVKDFGFKDTKGLYTFFNYVDPDEIQATVDMMYLPTLAKGAALRDDDHEPSKVNLCIVPGIEGHYNRFRVLCERLKLPALVLQPGLDHPYETVRETAERFVKVYLKKIEMDDTFHLLGYESGVAVALEMAAILEDRGLTGKVFCVGCAPHELPDELSIQLAEFENEDQLQNGILRHIYTLMGGEAFTLLEDISQKTCSEKIEAYVRILLGRVAHSGQYARTLMEYAVARINYMLNYKGYDGRQLRSQIVLLRAALGHAQLQQAVLQKLSKQTVVVHQLGSSLANITSDLRCAAIINEYLDSAILDDFETKNICNTYLLNSDSLISML
ncbi:unnamed protein product [Arctia plantaginis]|uniref:Ketosynthase family 3 (KS3) domain-containing protein n=1 Tax=Arctia plantaginis TaxID=874455 RepID=A0A8S1ALT4_ARCPL|nr:unnamed protein product [Arctia plantaginis]